MKTVVGLLSGPGVVWELKFGSWVLLQPGRINTYAHAGSGSISDRLSPGEMRVFGG